MKLAWLLLSLGLLAGCYVGPLHQLDEAVQKAREGNRMAQEALDITKQMNQKLKWQRKLQKLSQEMLRIADRQIEKRDVAKTGAEEGVKKLRKVLAISQRAYRRSRQLQRLGTKQARMVDEQIEILRQLLAYGRRGYRLSEEAKQLLRRQLEQANF